MAWSLLNEGFHNNLKETIMSTLTRLFAAAAFAACASTSASAATIDFNAYPAAPGNGTILGTITVDGYNFTSPHAHVITAPGDCTGSCASNGTQYVGGDMASLKMDKGGAAFSVASFDFAEAFADLTIPTTLTVQAFFMGGGSSSQTFAFDGVYDGTGPLVDFQNLTVNLTNLSSLQLSADGWFAVDNINTEATVNVPEPAMLSLMALGLAGLGVSRRRRT
jgi:hypothetical protein